MTKTKQTILRDMAEAILDARNCGFSDGSDEEEAIFCDDMRLGDETDGYGNLLRQVTCECRQVAQAAHSAYMEAEGNALKAENERLRIIANAALKAIAAHPITSETEVTKEIAELHDAVYTHYLVEDTDER